MIENRRRCILTLERTLLAAALALPLTVAACGSDSSSPTGKKSNSSNADDDADDDVAADDDSDDDPPAKDMIKRDSGTPPKRDSGTKTNADAGSGDKKDSGTSGPKAGGIPCNVAKVLEAQCAKCHGDPTDWAAPMSLVNYDDFHAAAPKTKGQNVDAVVLTRINDTKSPMPPAGEKPMPEADKKVLADWLKAGAKAGTGDDSCVVKTPAKSTDEPNEQTPTDPNATCYKFMNHGKSGKGDTSKYPVNPGEIYAEFYFDAPWKEPSAMVSFRTLYDDTSVLHHWLMYQHQGTQADGTVSSGIGSHIGANVQLLAGWAVGGDDIKVPKGIAAKMPDPGGKIFFEWHYYNPTTGAKQDASGIEICVVPLSSIEPKKIATLTWVGNENLGGSSLGGVIGLGGMPPGQESKAQDTCTPKFAGLAAGEPVRIFSFTPHMHKLGRNMRTWLVKKDGKVTKIFDEPFVFNRQSSYNQMPEIELYPGDRLVNECTFYNDTSKAVGFGPSSDQEMCYQFTYAYPANALVNGVSSLTGATNTCWDNKPADAARFIQMAP